MKFKDIPYNRPDIQAYLDKFEQLTQEFAQAQTVENQLAIFKTFEEENAHLQTLQTLANIRNTLDTRDDYYQGEQDFFDANEPKIVEKVTAFTKAILNTPFRAELVKEFGQNFFNNLEMQQKSFSPEIMELMAQENELNSRYQKLYASAQIEFDGKVLNIAKLAAYKQHADRQVRKAAVEAEGNFFESHEEEFDEIFDQLVKNRTKQAEMLGFENYVELGYLRRQRCYSPSDVAAFRKQVRDVMVPKNIEIKRAQAQKIGVHDFKFYDDGFLFLDGNATPKGTPEELLALAKQMYSEMSPETKDFIHLMMDNDLFDVVSREGKAPGGYCTTLPDYKCPFIFSNFNGTSGDVDVLTHEAGHAFAAYMTQKTIPYASLRHAPMEACEVHSMSMEFLSSPWHHLFFKQDTDKYAQAHAESALLFIPYGIMVDYFQQIIYSNPQLTPQERKDVWLKLEAEFRPYNNFDTLPFYSKGAGWQRQPHIYTLPFYYIDYCLAQTIALQFFALFLENKEKAWTRYMEFVKIGGMKNFTDTLKSADLLSPFEAGSIEKVCKPIFNWLESFK